MDFNETVIKRRSLRKFKRDAVPNEVLNRILEAGRWAPSASNLQPWHFIVVTDVNVKAKIAENCTRFSRKMWSSFKLENAKYLAQRGGTWEKSYMKTIPVLIVVCYKVSDKLGNESALASAWTAIENMLLSATAENLGSCPYTFYDSEEVIRLKETLQIPQEYRIAAIIQLGYPSSYPPTPSRKGLEEIVSYQHF